MSRLFAPDRLAVLAPVVVFCLVYGPVVGVGLIQDDYRWILESRLSDVWSALRLFALDNGFYRPVVALSFGLNERMFGSEPWGYGMTNLLLAVGCWASIAWLGHTLGLRRGPAALAAATWLLNPQGIRMAVQWPSGRTALLLTMGCVLSAAFMMRRRYAAATIAFAVAIFSKEEATLFPVILVIWLALDSRFSRRVDGGFCWFLVGLAFVEGLYFALRSHTHAMIPSTAPSFYQFAIDPGRVVNNAISYLDRGATMSALIATAILLVAGRRAVQADLRVRWFLSIGIVWFVIGYGLTIFLPVRSDLYACFPSVGVCLIVGAIAQASWDSADVQRRRRLFVSGIVALFVLTPFLMSRTDRWASIGAFSEQVLDDLSVHTLTESAGSEITLIDDRTSRANLDSAFGSLLPAAYELRNGRRMRFIVEPPLTNPLPPEGPCEQCVRLKLRVQAGRLVPE